MPWQPELDGNPQPLEQHMKQMKTPRGTARAKRRAISNFQLPTAAALAQEVTARAKAHARVITKLAHALFRSHGKAALPV